MIEFVGFAAVLSAVVLGYAKTREFVRSRLRYVESVHRAGAPLKAGAAAALIAAPVVWLLPVVTTPAAVLFGVAVAVGVRAGSRDIRKQLPGH